jgi:CRP/FNR family transcriptional regulator, cyclic AMP receptor protein
VVKKVNPTVELLRKVGLFGGLSARELETVADVCKRAKFKEGVDIVTQGERSARMYIVIEGTAEVRVHDTKVDEIGPGDYFGEIAIIDGEPRAATVTATSPLTALTLADFNVRALLQTTPGIGFKMLRTACARIRALESEEII